MRKLGADIRKGWLILQGKVLIETGVGGIMPYIGAALAASILGWWIDDLLQPYLGTGVTLAVSFVCSTAVFFIVRNWLLDLRGQ